MKKIVFVITAMITAAAMQAQSFNFEAAWNPTPPSSTPDPQGWASFNTLTIAGMAQTVFKETASPYNGAITAKIVTEVLPGTILIPNPFNPSEDLDTVGLLAVGQTQFSPPSIIFGKPFTNARPAILEFACKYSPNGSDSAMVVAFLTKWNGTSRDTLAAGWWMTGTASSSYAVQTMNMVYNPSFPLAVPDSQQIFVSSSVFTHSGAKKGSTFWIDDFWWSGWNSVDEMEGGARVAVYPNPSYGEINLECSVAAAILEVMDISGKRIGKYEMKDSKIKLETGAFAPGLYLFNMYNKEKELVSRGKFETAK